MRTEKLKNNTPASAALRLMAAGLIFLVNPVISVFDFLPDFIGCLLISRGVAKLSPASPALSEALPHLRKLVIISLLRFACLPLIAIIGDSEKAFILVFTLCFAMAELIFAIMAAGRIFEGLSYLGLRYSYGKRSTSGAFAFTVIFLSLRSVLNVLPDMRLLPVSESEYSDVGGSTAVLYNIGDYYEMLLLLNIVIVLTVGIVWCCVMSRRIRRAASSPEFCAAVSAEITGDGSAATVRAELRSATLTAGIGMLSSLDLFIDGGFIIPDSVCLILLLISALKLRGYTDKAKPAALVTGFSIMIAAASDTLHYLSSASIIRLTDGYGSVMLILSGITSAAVITSLVLFLGIFADLINRYSGFMPDINVRSYNEKLIKTKQKLLFRSVVTVILLSVSRVADYLRYIVDDSGFTYISVTLFGFTVICAVYLLAFINEMDFEISKK